MALVFDKPLDPVSAIFIAEPEYLNPPHGALQIASVLPPAELQLS